MLKEYYRGSVGKYQKWERNRVIKKFTILPLRIYQYSSMTMWWSWLETTYIYQSWHVGDGLSSYFFGGYWRNERISDIEEYNDCNDYEQFKNKML